MNIPSNPPIPTSNTEAETASRPDQIIESLQDAKADQERCWACKAELKEGQLYCRQCSHWQKRWRIFSIFKVSNVAVALLAALIGVIFTTGQQIKQILHSATEPNMYVHGTVEDAWGGIVLEVHNLDANQFALPTVMECNLLSGDAAANVGSDIIRYGNSSAVLVRSNADLSVSYSIYEMKKEVARKAAKDQSIIGMVCKGSLDTHKEYTLSVTFAGSKSIAYKLYEVGR